MLICSRSVRSHFPPNLPASPKISASCLVPQAFANRLVFQISRRLLSFTTNRYGAQNTRNQGSYRPGNIRAAERAAAYEGFLPRTCIPSASNNADAWLSVIEPILPKHLRESHQDFIKEATFMEYLPQILVRARRSYNVDILSYLGVEKGRWRAVVWLAKEVIDRNPINEDALISRSDSASVQWSFVDVDDQYAGQPSRNPEQSSQPWPPSAKLDDICREPLWLENDGTPSHMKAKSLEQGTQTIDTIADTGLYVLRKIAVGQIWRSLGNLILAAAKEEDASKSLVMPHVLEIIAHLHHVGVITDSVYEYSSTLSDYALKQPPVLRILSSRILSALSDAVWQAHELQVEEEKKAAGAQYTFLGHEIPGSRYRSPGLTLGTEVWLEFVLWSCLYGGWVEDGLGILQATYATGKSKRPWTLMCWQDVMIKHKSENSDPVDWPTIARRTDLPLAKVSKRERRQGRARVERTISSEVVIAYIDALVSGVRVGVGKRGIPVGLIVQNIITLKSYLDLNNMGLGAASWDTLIIRLVESQGIDVEEDPGFINHVLAGMSAVYGEGLKTENSRTFDLYDSEYPSYVFDGSGAILGLYHRAMRAFINRGDVDGAFKIFVNLQDYTDRNKKRAIEDFGKVLRKKRPKDFFDQRFYTSDASASAESSYTLDPFHSDHNANTLNTDYPALFPRIPKSVSAALLDLITATKSFDFGHYLVASQDIDGPIIPESLYSDRILAGSLTRFATATQDRDLLLKIVGALRNSGSTTTDEKIEDRQHDFLPGEVILTLLENQIRNRKWEAVENVLDHIRDASDVHWTGLQLAQLAREMLLHGISIGETLHSLEHSPLPIKSDKELEQDENARSLARALRIFLDLATGRWDTLKQSTSRVSFMSLMGLLADLGPQWAALIRRTRKFKKSQKLRLPLSSFHCVLEGVVGGRGAMAGVELIEKWCGEFEYMRPHLRDPRAGDTKQQVVDDEADEEDQRKEEVSKREDEGYDEESEEERTSSSQVEVDTNFEAYGKVEDGGSATQQASPEDLIRRDGGVPRMHKTRSTSADELQTEPVRVVLDEELRISISFKERRPANIFTIRIVLEGARKEWKEMVARQEENGVTENGTEMELKEVFDWIRDSFRKVGLSEEQIVREVEEV